MIPDAGSVRLRLDLDRGRGRVVAVHLATQRPRIAAALAGKPAQQAVELVPLLHAVCGQAQGAAARLALAAAQGSACPPQLAPAVARECVREHLWRLLLDLPPLLGRLPQRELFLRCQQALQRDERAALAALIAADEVQALAAALRGLVAPVPADCPHLPPFSAEESLAYWARLDNAMATQPTWRGAPATTGAGADADDALGQRWLARLEEVRRWSAAAEKVGAGGTVSAAPVAPGIGRALVQTSRGLLMHEIELTGDAGAEWVANYIIVAPTEWNFHPAGVLARYCLNLTAPDRAQLQAKVALAVASFDPCVPLHIEWGEAA